MWNCIFGSFKLFPSSKIDFWPFLRLQKMEFGQKKYSWNWFVWFHEFFGLDFFQFSGPLWFISLIFLSQLAIAEQDGICEPGEQLLTTPFGLGVCGCRLKPYLHVLWSFGNNQQRCYPLHQQGPCQQNETLHWNPRRNEPLCVPTVCPLGYVLSVEDGNCHVLNTQGKIYTSYLYSVNDKYTKGASK